jgi:hypothetical protein
LLYIIEVFHSHPKMPQNALKDEVHSAFADVKYPGDENLTIYSEAGRDDDATFQLLRGRSWENCPVAEFMSGDTPIPDLTAEAYHYYLPALLLASISDDDVLVNLTVGSLQFSLDPSNAKSEGEFAYDDTERFNRRINLLTPRQREVVIRVLREHVSRGYSEENSVKNIILRLEVRKDKL